MRWFILFLFMLPLIFSTTTYETCTHCSMLDEAWKGMGNSQVYIPGTGLVNYDTVYPPAPVVTTTSDSNPATTTTTTTTTDSGSIPVSTRSDGWQGCVADLDGDDEITQRKEALLDTIAYAEGSHYTTIVGYAGTFDCTQGHPKRSVQIARIGSSSNAAGRYQFMGSTYDDLVDRGYFPNNDFCDREQDRAGMYLARRVTEQDLNSASTNFLPIADKIATTWASIPYSGTTCSTSSCDSDCNHEHSGHKCSSGNSYYGQGTGKSLTRLSQVFDQCYKVHSGQIKRALVIGDSQVGGNGGIEIEKMLEEEGYYVDRVGCVGATTTHLLNGGKSCSQGSDEMQNRDRDYTLKPYDDYYDDHDLVILMAGGNEYTGGQVNAALYAKLQSADRCIVVGLIPLARSNSAMVDAYYISQEEHKGKCSFVDIKENVLVEGTHNSVGDPHLNREGGEAIADLIDDMIGIYSPSSS